MPAIGDIEVNMSARLVWIKDSKSIGCSLCPTQFFRTLYQAVLHSLKHSGRCPSSYPVKNNDRNIVDCCPKIVTHDKCLDGIVYGAVILIRFEIAENKIKLRLRCNFKKENPQNRKRPLNQACHQEFDSIKSYNEHVGSQHCQLEQL